MQSTTPEDRVTLPKYLCTTGSVHEQWRRAAGTPNGGTAGGVAPSREGAGLSQGRGAPHGCLARAGTPRSEPARHLIYKNRGGLRFSPPPLHIPARPRLRPRRPSSSRRRRPSRPRPVLQQTSKQVHSVAPVIVLSRTLYLQVQQVYPRPLLPLCLPTLLLRRSLYVSNPLLGLPLRMRAVALLDIVVRPLLTYLPPARRHRRSYGCWWQARGPRRWIPP